MRVGIGARQSYVTDTFDLNALRTVASKLRDTSTTGLEALLILNSRLSRLLSLDGVQYGYGHLDFVIDDALAGGVKRIAEAR